MNAEEREIQRPAFGRCVIRGIAMMECLACGTREPTKTPKHRKLFRERHAVCHQNKMNAQEKEIQRTIWREQEAEEIERNKTMEWKQYKRKGLSEMRPYVLNEDTAKISIGMKDRENGSPEVGDMIARNPKNHDDQWLVAKKYFEENLEPA